jgi:peptide deformylase
MDTLLDKTNPILRLIAEPVAESEFGSLEIRQLAQAMIDIMAEKGAVGVAAPQIGVGLRVIVFGTNYTKGRIPEYPISDTVLINPIYKVLSEDVQIDYEGCLNCGELRGKVTRPMEIEYSGYDLDGQWITKQAQGLEARILQHEVDHLNGILFLDRAAQESMTTVSELQQNSL